MNVLKIVVDKIPDTGCKGCFYHWNLPMPFKHYVSSHTCTVLSKSIDEDDIKNRPSWCPLVVEETCEWKEVTEWTSKIDSEGFWHIATKCDWVYPEDYDVNISELILDNVSQFVKQMRFTFCPNCGKRIEYKEE